MEETSVDRILENEQGIGETTPKAKRRRGLTAVVSKKHAEASTPSAPTLIIFEYQASTPDRSGHTMKAYVEKCFSISCIDFHEPFSQATAKGS